MDERCSQSIDRFHGVMKRVVRLSATLTRGARLGLLLHDVYLRPFPPGGFWD
jgi:hypothetical protein